MLVMAQGCAKGRRNAGWLQAGAEPSASGGGGVRGLVIHNVSVLGATPASAELSWLCSNGTLHGSASAVVPPMAGCVAPKHLKSDDRGSAAQRRRISSNAASHRQRLRGVARQESVINVRDFGATGSGACMYGEGSAPQQPQPYGECSGDHDDHAAVQQAVNAAIAQRRPLYFPAGVYMVGKPVVINGSDVSIFGDYWQDTVIAAAPGCKGAEAVLLFPTLAEGNHFGWNEVSGLSVNANNFANFGIQALTMTRSRFTGIGAFRAQAGLRLARGWELHVQDSYLGCAGGGNDVGVLATAAINSLVVLNSQFEGDHVGIAVNDGSNVRLEGNVIEGMGGAAIIVNSVAGVVVSAN